jgi:hypothetical protein
MKLSPKEYYFLREVAEAWGCTINDLFHYAIHDGLRLGVRISGEMMYGLNADLHAIGSYFVTGVLTFPEVCLDDWEAGKDDPCSIGKVVVDKGYPPEISHAYHWEEEALGPPQFGWARGRDWNSPVLDTTKVESFSLGRDTLFDIYKDSIVIHAVERNRFEAEMLIKAAVNRGSNSDLSWYEAKQIPLEYPPLRGDSWPKGLPTTHIARLHFPDLERRQRGLRAQLDDAIRRGEIACLVVVVIASPGFHEIPAIHLGTVLLEPEVRVMDYRNLGKRVLCRPRDKSWQDFLSEVVSERIEPSFLAIKAQLPGDMPSTWVVTRSDREPLCYRTCPIINASDYWAWEGRKPFPAESPLRGWIAKHVVAEETRDDVTQPNHSEQPRSASSNRQVEGHDTDQSNAALGRHRRAELQDMARHNADRQTEREQKWKRWRDEGEKIQAGRIRKASARQLAKLVKEALRLPDSEETIRRHL